ncbi:MAG: imidazole glycerol phosphate synthase subunit HisF [Planctomycetota bacterium]
MLTHRVIPCLDCRDGRVVKGVRFQNLRDSGDPAELASAYEQQGADELVLLDVSATPTGRSHQVDTVRRIRERLSIALTCGGGVRQESDAEALLEAGADKVGVNSAAVDSPELLSRLAARFGSQCVVIAIDAATRGTGDGWEVVVHSGKRRTGIDAMEWAAQAVGLGAGEILLTSWDRDGTRSGYDLELLRGIRERVRVPIIASGGADTAEHMADAIAAGADAVLAASIFHEHQATVDEVKRRLASLGVPTRTGAA